MVRYNNICDECLIVLAQEDRASREEICNYILFKYQGMIWSRIGEKYLPGAEKEDLYQEAVIGLINAIYAFDSSRNVPFQCFARICVDRRIMSALEHYQSLKYRPLNAAERLTDHNGREQVSDTKHVDPAEYFSSCFRVDALLRKLWSRLKSAKEKEVFLFMLHGATDREIAIRLKMSVKTVSNTKYRIRRKAKELAAEED